MILYERVLRNDIIRRVLCALATLSIGLAGATARRRAVHGGIPAAARRRGKPYVVAFRRGRPPIPPLGWRAGAGAGAR